MQKKNKYKDDLWISTAEDLPLVGLGYKRVSDFIWLKLEDGSVIEGYYVTDLDEWRDNSSKLIKQEVYYWQSM